MHAIAFAPFLLRGTPPLNDDVLHIATTRAAAFALATKGWRAWLDPLEQTIVTGYPFFHAYPPLGHLSVAWVSTMTGFSLEATHRFAKWVLLWCMPLAVYAGLRRFGLRARPALLSAAATHLITTNGSHGWDLGSYTWRGFGLYAQLWAAPFFAVAAGMLRLAIFRGRSLVLTGIVVGLTALAHVVYGYMLALTAVVLVAVSLMHPARRWRAPLRAGGLGAVSLALSGFFVIPGYVDRVLTNPSVWMPREKLDSVGHVKILKDWFTGAFLDAGRPGLLSVLVGIGIIAVILKIGHRRTTSLLVFFVAWLVLFFGRPTFGVWVDRLLPLSGDVHISRFVGAVHFAALGLCGLAVHAVLSLATLWKHKYAEQAAWLVVAIYAGIVIGERVDYFKFEKQWQQEVETTLDKDRADLDKLWAFLTTQAGSGERVYAGLPNNWGKSFGFGYVPIYAEVVNHGFASLGYLYHVMSMNSDVMALFDESKSDDYNFFGVGWVIAPAEKQMPTFLIRKETFGRFAVYRAPASGLVASGHMGVELEGAQSEFYGAASKYFRSAERASFVYPIVNLRSRRMESSTLLGYRPGTPVALGALPSLTKVQRLESGERYTLVSEASQEGLVFLRTSYHPNWHVMIDGTAALVVPSMPHNVAVRVPAGVHTVEFQYVADPLKATLLVWGWIIVAFALLLSYLPARYQPLRRIAL